MKYIPKKADLKARILYASLFIISVFCMMIDFVPRLKPIFSSIGLVCLVASLYLFIRFEFTIYEYILIERNKTLDFYVNKITGRRSSYVCYFPLTDACEIRSYTKNLKKEICEKYKNVSFYKYNQNIFLKEKQVVIFNNDGKYIAIVFEPDEKFAFTVSQEISRIKESSSDESQL